MPSVWVTAEPSLSRNNRSYQTLCVVPVSLKINNEIKIIIKKYGKCWDFFIMLEVCCGLCRTFGPEVWIPESGHLTSGKIAPYYNQKRTLFSIWVLHVEFYLWSAFPLNIIGQNQSKKIRRQLNWNASRLENIFVPEHLYDFPLQRRNAMHALEGHHRLSRETCLTLKFFFTSLQKGGGFLSAQGRCAVRRTVAL